MSGIRDRPEMKIYAICPSPLLIRSTLRLVDWNVLLLNVGVSMIACVGEMGLRITTVFMYSPLPEYFHPQ